ncbi:MAG: SprT-like domain-containing protein [Gammaproteobacteria bacterium]
MTARRVGNALRDLGGAVLVVLVLSAFGTAVEPRDQERGIDARVAALLTGYAASDGRALHHPRVVLQELRGGAVASSSCDDWRIAIRPEAASNLSDDALDELLAHELAHLLVCAETGRSAAHGSEWWRRYHALRNLT